MHCGVHRVVVTKDNEMLNVGSVLERMSHATVVFVELCLRDTHLSLLSIQLEPGSKLSDANRFSVRGGVTVQEITNPTVWS